MQSFSSLAHKSYVLLFAVLLLVPAVMRSQGVTTAALNGVVTGEDGVTISRANVVAMHVPSGTQYRALSTTLGAYNLPNLRVGGPYRLTVTLLGYEPQTRDSVFLDLGQTLRHDFRLVRRAVQIAGVAITTDRDPTLNAGRTGAGTSIAPELVIAVPSIKRSTRDLTRLDPRSDGNFSHSAAATGSTTTSPSTVLTSTTRSGSMIQRQAARQMPSQCPSMPSSRCRSLLLHSTLGKAASQAPISTP